MNYKVEEKPAFTVFGVSRKINRSSVILNDPGDEVGSFWGEMIDNGAINKILSHAPGNHLMAMMWHVDNGEVFYYDENICHI